MNNKYGSETMRLDEKDKIIMTMYATIPDVSQEEIAKKIGLTQPSVALRVRKLKDSGALEVQTGINPFKMGLFMAKVDVTSNNPVPILDMFRECPYFANGFTVSGKHNLCLMFMSKRITTIESIVNHHIRSLPSVSDLEFNIIIDSAKSVVVPASLVGGGSNLPPCGNEQDCTLCNSFKTDKCGGCPSLDLF